MLEERTGETREAKKNRSREKVIQGRKKNVKNLLKNIGTAADSQKNSQIKSVFLKFSEVKTSFDQISCKNATKGRKAGD